ncbi:hypothetical protein [Variovorax sp. LT1R16]
MNRSLGLPLTPVEPPPPGLPEWEGLMRSVCAHAALRAGCMPFSHGATLH